MKENQFIPVLKAKVLVIPAVPMVEEVLAIIKPEVMEDTIIVLMLPKVEPSVLDVMTNGKPKSLLIKDFELSGD